jgi:tRNA U34 5-methylaminomethyl-2-thiouridine-forming methyltransferase MnmC
VSKIKTDFAISGDGSHTIKSTLFDAYYHSIHGAVAESEVVFIQAGLQHCKEQGIDDISVFEMGFGTGLNALKTYAWLQQSYNTSIYYHSVEAYPVDIDVIRSLNYAEVIGYPQAFTSMHERAWDVDVVIDDRFILHKTHAQIEDILLSQRYHVIFYDAFAPSCQSHLWEQPILQKMYDALLPGGVLVSYCVQGAFKRALRDCGFNVKKLPGPPRKREMLRASKV